MAVENLEFLLSKVRTLSSEMKILMEAKNYVEAGKIFKNLKVICSIAKINLLELMLSSSAIAARNIAREKHLQMAGEAAVKAAQAEADYMATVAARARTFGKFGGRFLGWAGVALLAKDGLDYALSSAKAAADRRQLELIGCYGDYADEYFKRTPGLFDAPFKDYDQWYASEVLPPIQERRSEFWRNFRKLFPQGAMA